MWGELLIDSLKRPRAAARRVLDAGIPTPQLVEAAVLVAVVGVVLGYLALRLSPRRDRRRLGCRCIHNPLLGARRSSR